MQIRMDAPVIRVTREARRILDRVWSIAENLELTTAAGRWLGARGIAASTAFDLGCRDFAPALDSIRACLRSESARDKRAAGFYDARGRPWRPLAELMRGQVDSAGICLPIYDGQSPVPVSWRWCFYRRAGCVPLHAEGIPPLLGLGVWRGRHAIGPNKYVIVCRGELDWLALHDAQRRAAVLGICAEGRGFRDGWVQLVHRADKVICVVPDDAPGRRMRERIFQVMAAWWGRESARARCVRCLLPSGLDAGRLHETGELQWRVDKILRSR